MTEYTRPVTWDDVKALARYLEDAAVISEALRRLEPRECGGQATSR